MERDVDRRLLALCQRDEIIGVRDAAIRAMREGDREAGYVRAWMDQLLQVRSRAATAITTATAAMAGQRLR